MMEIMDDRYGCRSTAVLSQLPTDQWYNCIGDNTLADAQCTSHRHPRRVNAQAQRRPELNIRASMSCATLKAAILRRPLNASPAMPKIYGSRGQTAVFRPRRINPCVNLC